MLAIPIILLVLCIGVARYAMTRHEEALKMGRRHTMPEGQTAGEAVREFLDGGYGSQDVQIIEHNALVSDYYDPKRRTLFLTKATMNGTDAASWAVALHEAAHALQEGEARKALDWRLGNVKLARYAPTVIGLTCIVLTFLKRLPFRHALLICAILFAVIMVMNVLSMPIEVNASKRAQAWIEGKLRKQPALLELFTGLLNRVAWRDTGVFVRSPMYLLFGMLPVGGKLRK
jgi:Zn-dependent membrane protease YugP